MGIVSTSSRREVYLQVKVILHTVVLCIFDWLGLDYRDKPIRTWLSCTYLLPDPAQLAAN